MSDTKRDSTIYNRNMPQVSFFKDMTSSTDAARTRLDKHQREMLQTRDVYFGGGTSGFLLPGYLADEMSMFPRNDKPFADLWTPFPLPLSGMNFSVPKLTGGASVAVQDPENATVSETDITSDQAEQHQVVIIAGQVDVARASLEHSFPGLDLLIASDLKAARAEKLDAQLLSGTGANSQHQGIRSVSGVNTVSVTSATAKDIQLAILQGASKVSKTRLRWPTHCILHPATYAFIQADSGTASLNERQADALAKIEYVLDSNVGTSYNTNQSEIYLVYAPDLVLAQQPGGLIAEQPVSGTLTVRIQQYSYSLSAYRTAKSIAVISGAGLAAQSGF